MISSILSRIIFWSDSNLSTQELCLTRPTFNVMNDVSLTVNNIFKEVKLNGDKALYSLSERFDNIKIKQFLISEKELIQADVRLSLKIKQAIMVADSQINRFHQAQEISPVNIKVCSGVHCYQLIRPITSVGLYVPGGSAPLLSTVLMLAIPARIAGCKRVILCSPPPITDEILYAARFCGVQEIYQIGGAQAIAAMSLGTESIAKVNKIFGPGNIWVTEAKRQVSKYSDNISIDMLAGPSEILIIADNKSNPSFIAADLLAQAEHGPDSQVILLTPEIQIVKSVIQEIEFQLKNLSRISIIKQALNNSWFIVTKDLAECIMISNRYGPEHLMIHTSNPESLVKYITNAGSIFLGKWSAVSIGDYASGANHVLPTCGYTSTYSGLSLIDFQKRITVQQLSSEGLLSLSSTVKTLAQVEKLTAHEKSITLRIAELINE